MNMRKVKWPSGRESELPDTTPVRVKRTRPHADGTEHHTVNDLVDAGVLADHSKAHTVLVEDEVMPAPVDKEGKRESAWIPIEILD